jgi:hypothetical protein
MAIAPIDNQSSEPATYIGSKQPQFPGGKKGSHGGYGQNGYLGASSDTKIGTTKSGFLPDPSADKVNSQTRTLDGKPIATHPSMRGASAGPHVGANTGPVTQPATKAKGAVAAGPGTGLRSPTSWTPRGPWLITPGPRDGLGEWCAGRWP